MSIFSDAISTVTGGAEVIIKNRLAPLVATAENALTQISPGWALKRKKSRIQAQALGSYIPSKERRAGDWSAPTGDFKTDVLPELPALRENSENLYCSNPIARAAIDKDVISTVGVGLTSQPSIDEKFLGLTKEKADEWEANAARRWLLWSESKFCTVNRKHNFREFIALAYQSAAIRGDSFTLTPEEEPETFFPFRLRLQLIEADRVCNENDVEDSETLSGGIETFPNGRLKQAHIRTTHPGSASDEQKWDKREFFGKETGRRNILHFYKSIRGDQSRGVPNLAPVIESLKQFGTLTQAAVDAAVIQTFLSVFIKTEAGELLNAPPGASNSQANPSMKLGQASVIGLADGEEIQTVNPTQPNSGYAAFAAEFEIQIGAALGQPKEVLMGHFQSSYSAAQAALLEAWRYYKTRRGSIIDNLCQPIYVLFIAGEVASGTLVAPGFFTDPMIKMAYCGATWVGPPRGHIKEVEQNKADLIAEKLGWKTNQQNTQERGNRQDRNHRQRAIEIQRRKEDGLITTDEALVGETAEAAQV